MSKKLLGQYRTRMIAREAELKRNSLGGYLMVADCSAFAHSQKDGTKGLPVKGSGNPEFVKKTSGGTYSHAARNQLQAVSHNKRGLATTGASTVASIGAGVGTGMAIGSGAAAAGIGVIVASAAITGGIALAGVVVGIAIAAGVAAYTSYRVGSIGDRFAGAKGAEVYEESTEMMTDLKYALSNGELEKLARFMDKATETGKFLDTALNAPVDTCGDAAVLAYAMHRHKWRLRDKLDKGREMDHLAAVTALIDNKISACAQMCEIMGEMHTANMMIYLAVGGSAGRSKQQDLSYAKSTSPTTEVRDYTDLRWKLWYERLEAGTPPERRPWMNNLAPKVAYKLRTANNKATMKSAFAGILKEAKNSSDGDHKNACGKIMDALNEASNAPIGTRMEAERVNTGSSGARAGGIQLIDFTTAQLQGVVMTAAKTAAGSASVSSALGSSAIGSVGNIAGSAGAGLAAGILVSALVGYALEKENDKRNVRDIFENKVTDPAQRMWLLRSMMQAGRLETLTESFKKAQQSIEALQALYGNSDEIRKQPAGSGGHMETTHADMVTATKHLFRLQKHMLRMFAVSSVLNMFWNEMNAQVDALTAEYSREGGQADRVLTKVERQVEKLVHNCPGTCYRVTAIGSGETIKVANRLVGVPASAA